MCLPTFAGFLIVISVMLHPNALAYLLIPLAFVAPISLAGGVTTTVETRHNNPSLRTTSIILALALLAGAVAIILVRFH